MTPRFSRRALFLGLAGPEPTRSSATSAEPRTEPTAEPEAPWARRERARAEAAALSRVARITPFACLARAGCTVCSERCPEPGAIVLHAGRPRIEESMCTGCGACADACPAPERAILVLPRVPATARSE